MLKDNYVDICCISESWLKNKDSAKFAEIHDLGFDIHSAPRKGKGGGGVAFLFDPKKVKPIRNNVKAYKSFEVLECLLKTSSKLLRLVTVYRSTQRDRYNDTKMNVFLDEFDEYLDVLVSKGGTPIIMGDFKEEVGRDPTLMASICAEFNLFDFFKNETIRQV